MYLAYNIFLSYYNICNRPCRLGVHRDQLLGQYNHLMEFRILKHAKYEYQFSTSNDLHFYKKYNQRQDIFLVKNNTTIAKFP